MDYNISSELYNTRSYSVSLSLDVCYPTSSTFLSLHQSLSHILIDFWKHPHMSENMPNLSSSVRIISLHIMSCDLLCFVVNDNTLKNKTKTQVHSFTNNGGEWKKPQVNEILSECVLLTWIQPCQTRQCLSPHWSGKAFLRQDTEGWQSLAYSLYVDADSVCRICATWLLHRACSLTENAYTEIS